MGELIEIAGLVIGAGLLVIGAVELFRRTKRSRGKASTDGPEGLVLSDHAKAVLTQMQSDPTDEGIFELIRFLGPSAPRLVCVYHTEIDIEVNNRVMSELEAKGLVTIIPEHGPGGDKVTLTSLGWALNPETGKADKAG